MFIIDQGGMRGRIAPVTGQMFDFLARINNMRSHDLENIGAKQHNQKWSLQYVDVEIIFDVPW